MEYTAIILLSLTFQKTFTWPYLFYVGKRHTRAALSTKETPDKSEVEPFRWVHKLKVSPSVVKSIQKKRYLATPESSKMNNLYCYI